jgi:hypothetical protein
MKKIILSICLAISLFADGNPFVDGYIQDDNPFGDNYVQDKGVFGLDG